MLSRRRAPADPEAARIKRNHETIHRFYEAINNKQLDVFSELLAPDFVSHGGVDPDDVVGVQAFVESLAPLYEAMPDWHVAEDYAVAQNNSVGSRSTLSGTHLGNFMGAAPSGKKVSWTGLTVYHLNEDGKIIERWQDFDRLNMLQQLGVIPSNS